MFYVGVERDADGDAPAERGRGVNAGPERRSRRSGLLRFQSLAGGERFDRSRSPL
jgi:hypothetical protein